MGAGLSLFAVRRPELIVRLAPSPWSVTPKVIGPGPLPCLPNLHIRDSREQFALGLGSGAAYRHMAANRHANP
jgi:hypothetical protein